MNLIYSPVLIASVFTIAVSYPHEPLVTCKDGAIWNDDCNTCWCDNGQAACTRKGCIHLSKDELGLATCKEGEKWKDDCNDCWCDNGHPACTEMACKPKPLALTRTTRSEDELGAPTCKEGEKWNDGCNDCWCDNGLPACTEMACIPNPLALTRTTRSEASYPQTSGATCKEGDTWKDDCNTCWCNNGHAACTLMGCVPAPTGELGPATCKEGDTWKDDCNNCWCDNGHPACTQMACIPKPLALTRTTRSKDCDCDPFGALRPTCDTDGSCFCRTGFYGKRCDRCAPQYHMGPDGCQEDCVPLTAWKKGHVICTCSVQGVETCEHELNRVRRDTTIEDVLKHYAELHEDCTAGTVWKSNCANCKCTEQGPFCTAVPDCTPGPIVPPKTSCVGDERWMDECNSCWCEQGQPQCTRKGCEGYPHYELILPADHQQTSLHISKRDTQKSCKAGDTWMEDCNQCTCNDEGKASCSKILCQKDHAEEIPWLLEMNQQQQQDDQFFKREVGCMPGKVWIQMTDNDEGCAKFTCHADGSVTSVPHFTREMCPSHPEYIEDDDDDHQQQQQQHVVKREAGCTPGKVWIQMTDEEGCAKFKCHADGSVTSTPHFTREMCPSHPEYIEDDDDDQQQQQQQHVAKREAGEGVRSLRARRSRKSPPATCTPGVPIVDACFYCACLKGGPPVCTYKDC